MQDGNNYPDYFQCYITFNLRSDRISFSIIPDYKIYHSEGNISKSTTDIATI